MPSLSSGFVVDEVDYVLGRFVPEALDEYLATKREGRGKSPRMDRATRGELLDRVITPYNEWKEEIEQPDWNDLAVNVARTPSANVYDIVVIDEAQDFSANQVRAVLTRLAPDSSITFVLDGAQRIYPRYFAWSEVGLTITSANSVRLSQNYCNTAQIAHFAAPLVDGLDIGIDGTIPDFSSCPTTGPLPLVLVGKYAKQASYVIDHINKYIDLAKESVVFLHPKGGKWFDFLRVQLIQGRIMFAEITREGDWPTGSENVALSTMHSAKGLEFDHVFLLGLNAQVTPHGEDTEDTQLETLRRLLAMSIGRARKSVIVGYKPEDATSLISLFSPGTYTELKV